MAERQERERHVEQIQLRTQAIDFGISCAHAYGEVCRAVRFVGRKPRGARSVDLLIAATGLAHELPIYTLNAADLRGLEGLIEIVDLTSA